MVLASSILANASPGAMARPVRMVCEAATLFQFHSDFMPCILPVCPVYCSGEVMLTEDTGPFSPHSTIGDYPPLLNCSWRISAPPPVPLAIVTCHLLPPSQGCTRVLSFGAVFLGAGDFVEVWEDTANGQVSHGRFFDWDKSPPLVALGELLVRFTSDGVQNARGFKAVYTTGTAPP
jgi:hypothetical protein